MKYTRDEIRRAMLLYAVTDSHWLKEGQTLADVTAEVVKSGVTFLQIREKGLAPEAFEAEAEALKKLCNAAGVPFVVNDSVEIALACDADGVHVGQSDIRGRDIRAIIGPDKILGITANTVERAVAAEKAGADYIGVGAMFATGTKKNAVNIPISRLQDIRAAVSIPIVAIGGITEQNMDRLAGSGADGIAVVSAIFAAEEPAAAAKSLREHCERIFGNR